MEDLSNIRKSIDEVDDKIKDLFIERMMLVKKVSEYKKKYNLPIFDASREKEILEKKSLNFDNLELKSYYLEFIQYMMDLSKDYQKELMNLPSDEDSLGD